jgi:hypothetical protein
MVILAIRALELEYLVKILEWGRSRYIFTDSDSNSDSYSDSDCDSTALVASGRMEGMGVFRDANSSFLEILWSADVQGVCSHTLRAYSVCILCAHTQCAYSVRVLSARTLCVYSVRILCAHTLCTYSVLILSARTLCVYSVCVLGARTLCAYSVRVLGARTLCAYSVCIVRIFCANSLYALFVRIVSESLGFECV